MYDVRYTIGYRGVCAGAGRQHCSLSLFSNQHFISTSTVTKVVQASNICFHGVQTSVRRHALTGNKDTVSGQGSLRLLKKELREAIISRLQAYIPLYEMLAGRVCQTL